MNACQHTSRQILIYNLLSNNLKKIEQILRQQCIEKKLTSPFKVHVAKILAINNDNILISIECM